MNHPTVARRQRRRKRRTTRRTRRRRQNEEGEAEIGAERLEGRVELGLTREAEADAAEEERRPTSGGPAADAHQHGAAAEAARSGHDASPLASVNASVADASSSHQSTKSAIAHHGGTGRRRRRRAHAAAFELRRRPELRESELFVFVERRRGR